MLYSIKFSDNTKINIVGNTAFNKFDIIGYTNSLLAYRKGGNVFGYMFSDDKYDLDGNRWHLQTTGNRGLFIYYAGGGAFYSPIDMNSQYTGLFLFTNGSSVIATSIDAFIDSYSQNGQQFETFISQNPNSRIINFLTGNYSIALYTGNSELPLNWGGTGLDLTKFNLSYTEVPESTDPYNQGGESEGHIGGDGTYEDESDPIPIPPEPTLSAANTNFIRLYNPSIDELRSLANYMWSGLFDLDTFKKIFSDPISCILGLSIVPVAVPNGGVHSVVIGNVDTEVLMTRAQSQYVTVECGSLTISEYWGAYLDYAPFTKFELYLPYIGVRPISADDVMGKTISITYRVDILSGSCIAYVKCGASVLYSFIGQCSSSIPITGKDWTNVINGALNIAGAIGTVVATGGFQAPAAIAGTAAGAMYQTGKLMSTGAALAQNVAAMKPQIEKSGSLSGTGGLLGIQKPYLIITRPKQALPAYQNSYTGYPSFVTVRLGDISGYTEVDSIHLENIPATSAELDEIETLLKGGVIL